MDDRSANLRTFFARFVAARAAARDPRIEQAFASAKREDFAGPGPWSIMLPGHGYLKTPDDDVAFLYQDTLVAIDAERGINIGQPAPPARRLDAPTPRAGEAALPVGGGGGVYSPRPPPLPGARR